MTNQLEQEALEVATGSDWLGAVADTALAGINSIIIALMSSKPAGARGDDEFLAGVDAAHSLRSYFESVSRLSRLSIIGRDVLLIEALAKKLHDKASRLHDYTPLRRIPRGNAFEVQLDDGRIARVTVELDRVEQAS